jgi:tRNA-guanine family transglycosylase
MLLSEHNIFYYQDLMKDIRQAIENKNFDDFHKNFIAQNLQNEIEE